MTYLNVIFLNRLGLLYEQFIFLLKETHTLGLSLVLFNSKHNQCWAFFEFRYLLLIWSTTPRKNIETVAFS